MYIFLHQSLWGLGLDRSDPLFHTYTNQDLPYRCEWGPSHTNDRAENEGECGKVRSVLQRHQERWGGLENLMCQSTSFIRDFSRNSENLSCRIISKNVSSSGSEDLMQTPLIPSPWQSILFTLSFPKYFSSPNQKQPGLVESSPLSRLQIYSKFTCIYILQKVTQSWGTISMWALRKMGNVITSYLGTIGAYLCFYVHRLGSFLCAIRPV